MVYDFYIEVDGEWHSSEDICKSIRRVLHENTDNKHLIPERVEVLGNIFVGFYKITGKMPQMRFRPAFGMGSVSLELPDLELCSDQCQKFASILQLCNTFEVMPLVSGEVRISATVDHMYQSE